MIDRRLFLGTSLAAASCTTIGPPRPKRAPLWGRLTAGPFAPGFSIGWLSDGARRVQRWRWYPARPATGAAMTAADYGRAFLEGAPAGWPANPDAVWATGYDEPGDAAKMARLAPLPVAARRDGRPAVGAFPLVVLGQGWALESPFHQHVLAEYLASWGYRVVTAPLVGPLPGRVEVSPGTLAQEIADLRRVAASEQQQKAGLALVGYDLGGMAAIAMAGSGALRPDVVIGIDTGLMSAKLTDELIVSRPDFSWDRLDMPYVHFTRTAAENEARKLPEDLRIFEGAKAPRELVRIPQMRHVDFALIGAMEGVFPALFGPVEGNPAAGHALTAWAVRDALDHFVRRRAHSPWRPPLPGPASIQTFS